MSEARTDESMSAVIPAYNEEECLVQVVEEVDDVLSSHTAEHEVVIVDDGSADGTANIADRLARERPTIRVIHHEVNKGVCAAIRTGIAAAGCEWVFFVPADGQFDIKEIDRFIPLMPTSDVVAGMKSQRSDYTAFRKLSSAVFTFLIRGMFGLVMDDYNYVQLYRRSLFDEIEVRSDSMFITAEILVKAHRAGRRISSVTATYYPRAGGQATGGRPMTILKTIKDMLAFRITGK